MTADQLTAAEVLPWTVTESPAQDPGPPGDVGEELVESALELRRGKLPWESEGSVDLTSQNTVVVLVLVALLWGSWQAVDE